MLAGPGTLHHERRAAQERSRHGEKGARDRSRRVNTWIQPCLNPACPPGTVTRADTVPVWQRKRPDHPTGAAARREPASRWRGPHSPPCPAASADAGPTHHGRGSGQALQLEDVHAGLGAAHPVTVALARLRQVTVGAVRIPGERGRAVSPRPPGPGARSSPHVCRPAGRSGPRGPAGSSAPVAAPAPSRLPSVPLSGAGVSSRRRGHTWDSVLVPVLAPTPPQKARGGSSLADLPAQPARARRTRAPSPRAPRGYVQGAPQVLERGSLLGGRGAARALGHPPRTAPQGPLAL